MLSIESVLVEAFYVTAPAPGASCRSRTLIFFSFLDKTPVDVENYL